MSSMRISPKATNKIAIFIIKMVALFTMLLLISFVGYVIWNGRASLNLSFLTSSPKFMEEGGGIGPQLFNSIYLVVLSMLITVPIGLCAGIYMAEYAKQSRFTRAVRFCIETLASLPSIVIGLFGLILFVTLTKWGYTLMGGALAVSILNLPVITRISEDAIRSVPDSIKEASLGIGATHWQSIYKVILPAAFPGLLTGIIITAGRVFGEAAALLFTAGMSNPNLNYSDWNPFSPNSPLNPFRPAETLAVYIFKINSEGLAPDSRQIADGASAVLIICVFIFNVLARYLGQSLHKRYSGK